MITIDKLKIYQKYSGDVHGLALIGNKKDQTNIDDEDWHLIGDMVQDIYMIKTVPVSESFLAAANKKQTDNCESVEVILQLKAYAINRYTSL